MINIGKLAYISGVSTDTIRYYERIGLVEPEGRTSSGYRTYSSETVRKIKFIKKAQGLGFSLDEIRTLLDLSTSDAATAGDVLKVAEEKIVEFKHKILELEQIRNVLEDLAARCSGTGPISNCPILDHLYPEEKEYEDAN